MGMFNPSWSNGTRCGLKKMLINEERIKISYLSGSSDSFCVKWWQKLKVFIKENRLMRKKEI